MPRKDNSETSDTGILADGGENGDRKRLIDHVEVICEAILGSGTITIGQLDRLVPGEMLMLDSSPADPAEIRVNGKVIARGEVVTVDDRFAIRLTEIG
ncbi:FliM/FliN family flagellar motor C-terminal domain-containing protein [Sphingopyxis sp.]|uniref:FliM/FliN family flagellar motor C-terminal domain-containing protein n=1 Tax=Sphingopyxis sp. TaxID=1908224 RepID=UPI002FCC867D